MTTLLSQTSQISQNSQIGGLDQISRTDQNSDEKLSPEEIIIDLSLDEELRINSLKNCSLDVSVEIIRRLGCMYQMSGIKILQEFFVSVCDTTDISSFIRLESANNLLDYSENNDIDTSLGYKSLNKVCSELSQLSVPCRIKAIIRLMNSDDYQTDANEYFKQFISDDSIDCDFRYKSILSLENDAVNMMKDILFENFTNKNIVKSLYTELSPEIIKFYTKFNAKKIDIKNKKVWVKIINNLSPDIISTFYHSHENHDTNTTIFDEFIPIKTFFFIKNAQLEFLFHKTNMTFYKSLAGQYLLRKVSDLSSSERLSVEEEILSFASDEELDYNRRADAADILLQLGSENMKQRGKDIIAALGMLDSKGHTVFDNKQNVHIQEVDETVSEVLEFLNNASIYKINDIPIGFNYVVKQVEDMMKDNRETFKHNNESRTRQTNQTNQTNQGTITICNYCESNISENPLAIDKYTFCSSNCFTLWEKKQKIRLALNRILIDRAVYSKYNNTLSSILVKIFSYIKFQPEEIAEQMYQRLLEELEDMSDTCSTGFASRLINVISGFGEFNMRISWTDQICANFSGRLNANVRRIQNPDSIFRTTRLRDVILLWLYKDENVSIANKIIKRICDKQFKKYMNIKSVDNVRPTDMKGSMDSNELQEKLVEHFLKRNSETKINKCIEDFSENVIYEMTISSGNPDEKKNFSLFFNTYVSIIREELYGEFRQYITDEEFDMGFRQAIMSYEGL